MDFIMFGVTLCVALFVGSLVLHLGLMLVFLIVGCIGACFSWIIEKLGGK